MAAKSNPRNAETYFQILIRTWITDKSAHGDPTQTRIRRDCARGCAAWPYASVEEYLEQAVTMLHRQEVWLAAHRDEIGAKIEEGWASAQRGEVFTPEQVQEEMRAKKQAWIEKQRTA